MKATLLLPVFSAAQTPRKDGHPDLSGIWAYTIGLPATGVKRVVNGSARFERVERGVVAKSEVPGALPSTPAPSYKPEFQAKVKNLFDNESKLDPVFYCGRPGVPRIGTPRRIVQLPHEMIFFYEDMSGDPYRIIPVLNTPSDGRKHRVDGNPSAYGDSVAHWESNTLVVDVTNFVDDTWFGEGGYLHSDAMHVTERLWRDRGEPADQGTREDPQGLTAPRPNAAPGVKPSHGPRPVAPACVGEDGHRPLHNHP